MSRLARNILWNLAGQAALIVLALVAVRLVFKQLGADAFGLILFAQTASAVLVAMLDLGISSAIVREVATRFASDRAYIVDVLKTATLVYWSGYLVLVGALFFLAPLLATRWLNLKTIDPGNAAGLLRILAVGALLALPRSLYGGLFRGLQEMSVTNLIEAGALAIQQVGVVVILALRGGIVPVAAWFSTSYALSVVAYLLMGTRFVPVRGFVPGFALRVVRQNARFSAYMTANSLLASVHMQLDKLLVSKLMPVAVLGPYGVAATLVAGVGRGTTSIMQAAFPSLSDLHARVNRDALIEQYRRVHSMLSVGMAPLFAALVFGAEPVLAYVFDARIARSLLVPVVFLSVGWYMNASLSAPYTVSLAVGRPQIAARQNLLALFVVVPVAIVLVSRFGLPGAAASWVIYHLFAYAYGLPRIYRECLALPAAPFFHELAKTGGLITTTYGVAFGVAVLAGNASIPWLAVSYAIATAVYVVVVHRRGGQWLIDMLLARRDLARRRAA